MKAARSGDTLNHCAAQHVIESTVAQCIRTAGGHHHEDQAGAVTTRGRCGTQDWQADPSTWVRAQVSIHHDPRLAQSNARLLSPSGSRRQRGAASLGIGARCVTLAAASTGTRRTRVTKLQCDTATDAAPPN